MNTASSDAARHLLPRAAYLSSSPEYRSSYRRQLAAAARRRGLQQELTPLQRTLGWLSIGMGMVWLLAPRAMSRAMGVADQPIIMRLLGARELVCGLGILRNQQASGWVWSRVAGDAMDMGLLELASRQFGNDRLRIEYARAAVGFVAGLDAAAAMRSITAGTS